MKKKMLFGLFVLFFIGFVSAGVTLNSPSDKNISASKTITFNATGTAGTGNLTNISLYHNATGTWHRNQTQTFLPTGTQIQSHNKSQTNTAGDTSERGLNITVNKDTTLRKVTTFAGTVAGGVGIYYMNKTGYANASLSSGNATFNIVLRAGESYYICMENETTSAWSTGGVFPYNDEHVNFTTGGINCADGYSFETTNVREVLSITLGGIDSTTKTFSSVIPVGNTTWNVEECDTGSVCAMATSNFTIGTDNPTITIIDPASTVNTADITINATFTSYEPLSICYYNITRGESTEKSNTYINCSAFNTTYTLTGEATYVISFFGNQSTGIQSVKNKTFTYALGGGGSSGGGGGGGITQIINILAKQINICEPARPRFEDAYNNIRKDGFSGDRFKELWNAFWDYGLCVNAGSIIPSELEVSETGSTQTSTS